MPKAVKNLPSFIDHTILKPDTSAEDIDALCKEAIKLKVAAVCVPPYFVKQAYEILKKKKVKVATVIGYPAGYSPMIAKYEEARECLMNGAEEIDLVINIAALKSGDWNSIREEIIAIQNTKADFKATLKVIVEAGLLSEKELKKVLSLCAELQVDYVKNSTGYGVKGANPSLIKMMRSELPAAVKIKASGGIKTREQAIKLIEAGADRIGTSSAVDMLSD